MQTSVSERLKMAMAYAKAKWGLKTQKEFGDHLGYGSSSYLSQVMNGSKNPEEFIKKLCLAEPDLNEDWILSNVGEMLNNVPKNDYLLNNDERYEMLRQLNDVQSKYIAHLEKELEKYKKKD